MSLPPELQDYTKRHYPAQNWSELDTQAIDTTRVLAADAVQKVGNGHPGTAMSLAPLAYTLYQKVINHNPQDPQWAGRDRFILSAGHSSLTQYIQLYLGGFGLELKDLEQLRTWGSLTPGHPEYKHTKGIEITTGPLGQGLASAVGFAMAQRRERGMYDPTTPENQESLFDHYTYVIASDGDLEEGVTNEAASIAGTQQLGKLIVFWDDNQISIEDNTQIAFTEDVAGRYAAQGWQILETKGEDVVSILDAVKKAQQETTKPTLIRHHTVIGYPAPTKMNTGAVHGSALGPDEVEAVKEILGFDPQKTFDVDDAVIAHTRELGQRGASAQAQWEDKFATWAEQNPDEKKLFDRVRAGKLPDSFEQNLPTWSLDDSIATRKASEATIQALAEQMPELWGGSADLAGSNNTIIKDAESFGPRSISTDEWTAQPYGRNLHFGIREHSMGSILNGISLHGNTRPYGGTFLVFSDYMRPAVRLAALMGVNVYYVWTHDSIGLGEDGPTHQPVEHYAALRAIPGFALLRPADGNETAAAWAAALNAAPGPKGFALSRQNLPTLKGTSEHAMDSVPRGGYVLVEGSENPDVILMGSGSEVQLAVEAADVLSQEGITARVVSMPVMDWFVLQDQAYRDSVIPPKVKARVSVEAGIAMPWIQFTGDLGENVSLEHFGASASAETLFEKFGITTEAVVAAAKKSLTATEAQ